MGFWKFLQYWSTHSISYFNTSSQAPAYSSHLPTCRLPTCSHLPFNIQQNGPSLGKASLRPPQKTESERQGPLTTSLILWPARKESERTESVLQGDWVEGGATVEAGSTGRLAGLVGQLEVQFQKWYSCFPRSNFFFLLHEF